MNKQIEELAKHCCFPCECECDGRCIEGLHPCNCTIALATAQDIYNAGYRRYDDLIEKMAEEVDDWKRYYESIYESAKATIRAEVATKILEEIKKKARTGYLLSDPPKIMFEILKQDLIKIIQEVTDDGNC